ncbi:TPA: hypothetical protein HA249_06920 [Candidatus Woesearchaeota archaeon]|nr:hypothetical protein [Candidatus Woesearchaeota archaeon]
MALVLFDSWLMLFWIFITSFIPGALLAVSILKRSELKLFEKILIGFGIGFSLPQIIPYLLSFVGIKFSFGIAILSTLVFYAIALALLLKEKPFEGFKLEVPKLSIEELKNIEAPVWSWIVAALLVIVMLSAFMLRISSSSPVFSELDPYYYTYGAQQIVTLGEMPLNDETAWFEDANGDGISETKVDHRSHPVLLYMEAAWYSFYTMGADAAHYDNYLLALVAGAYPPVAAALAFFFLYLFFAANYPRQFSLIGAAVASFVPIIVLKLSSGEMEVQPYAFFALGFFLSAYAWGAKEKKFENSLPFALVAALGYIALALGSSSAVVGVSAITIFIGIQSILMFLKSAETRDNLLDFAKFNLIIIGIALFLIATIIHPIYRNGVFTFEYLYTGPAVYMIMALAPTLLALVLYYLRNMIKDIETMFYALGGLILFSMLIFFFTPLKTFISQGAMSGLTTATFDTALKRTIAEQGASGALFQGQLGFMAATPQEVAETFLPPSIFGDLTNLATSLLGKIFAPLSVFANTLFSIIFAVVNALFNAGIAYDAKETSLLLVIISLSFLGILYSAYRSIKGNELTLFALYAAVLFPPALVGLLKAKYTIYVGFFFAGAIGLVFAELFFAGSALIKRFYAEKEETIKKYSTGLFAFLFLFGLLFSYLQFTHEDFSSSILYNSYKLRFQDNPAAFKEKLTQVCNQLKLSGGYDADVCEAANDPVEYASRGTNYQFDQKLCSISIPDNPFTATASEQRAISFKCQRLAVSWINVMEWIRFNTEKDARVISWWDYGHWLNFFGQRNAVIRNEHISLKMIGEVAKGYLHDTPEELAAYMKSHDSKYALFDGELVLSGGTVFGGKYGALNYLSCNEMGLTGVSYSPGTSPCELEQLWETIYIPKTGGAQQCYVSISSGKAGLLAYKLKVTQNPDGGLNSGLEPAYCVSDSVLADGQKVLATYELNQKDAAGNLKLNKAILQQNYETQDGVAVMSAYYTKDKIWKEGNSTVDGYADRKGKFYDSNLYKAYFLEDLPGFKLVYKTEGNEIKIFKLEE